MYLLSLGVLSTTYTDLLQTSQDRLLDLVIFPLEKSLELPYHKPDMPQVLGQVGFELSQAGSCLFPSFFLRMKSGFDAFFEENQISQESQRALNWTHQ